MRDNHIQRGKTVAALLLTAWLAACGGGGDGDTASAVAPIPTTPTTPATPTVLKGTVAIGAALINAEVTVRDRSGASACINKPVKTDVTGAYRCVLSVASLAPFAVLAVDPEGLINPMISVVGSKPAAGAESTANVTPLTTAIAAQLNNDPFAFFTNSASLGSLNLATLNSVKANVVTQIAAVLTDAGVNPATFDPVATPFVGGSGTGADKMLDQIRITFDNGSPTISNVLNPTAPAVPLADSSTSSISTVAAATVIGFSLSELDFAKTELERCFAVPSSTRTIDPDTAKRRLTAVAPECEDFAAKMGGAPTIDINFKNSGQPAEVYFYNLLTSADMDGAKFNLPELMRYATSSDGRDEAVLNIKYRDKNGVPGNLILTAKKFPGSRLSPSGATQWWLVGNQRSIDAFIRSAVRQREQLIPQTVLDNPSFFNAARSRFETGLEIFIQRPNNGTTVNGVNNPNNAVRYVRVKGPGLPNNGLVFGDVAQTVPQSWMGILNATGVNPNDASATQQRASTTSNIFLIHRTQGISGSAGFMPRPNPSVNSPTASFVSWAHPSMYEELASDTWLFDLSKVPAWSVYNFEVFCDAGTTPCETFSSSITTPLMPAPYAATQQWHSFTASSRSFVTDGALDANNAEIAWTPNTLAERIGSVNAYSFSPAGPVNSFSTLVPKGTFSRTVDAVGGQFPAISTSDNTRGRTLQIRHVMLDGSYKDHLIQFN